MLFYLVRHAHALWTPDENRPLSAQGQRDAEQVAQLLAGKGLEAIISSPYRRAVQTVEPLASSLSLKIHKEDRFRERTLGDCSAATFEQAVRTTWEDFQFFYPGGETNQMAQARAIEALNELLNFGPCHRLAIGTHGNLLALILNHYDPTVGYEFWSKLNVPDVYRLEVSDKSEISFARC